MGRYEGDVFVCTFGKTCSAEGADGVHAELEQRVKDAGSSRGFG